MEQKYILGSIAIAMVAILGISMVSAFGFGNGFINSELTEEEKAEMQEQHEAIQTAISDGDYATWKILMEERIAQMQTQLTEENFNKIIEQHQAMSENRKAMQDGSGLGKGMKSGSKIGMRNCPFAE